MATSPGAANLVRGDDLKDFIAAGWREHSVSPDVAPWRLPRWQSSTATISGGELIPAVSNAQAESLDRDEHFEQRKAEWERDQSIEVAAELVGSAIVLGRTGEVVPAARLLADPGSDATATLREMALHALGESPAQPSPTRPTHRGRLEWESLYLQISRLRQHLHRNPRDAYGWVDIARLYTILGQNAKARQALVTALALAPEDRFVLRASAAPKSVSKSSRPSAS